MIERIIENNIDPSVLIHYVLCSGGPDKRYTFVNEEDYRSDKIPSGVKYQLQAIHTTLEHKYNDTLNFLIRSNTSEVTLLEVLALMISCL